MVHAWSLCNAGFSHFAFTEGILWSVDASTYTAGVMSQTCGEDLQHCLQHAAGDDQSAMVWVPPDMDLNWAGIVWLGSMAERMQLELGVMCTEAANCPEPGAAVEAAVAWDDPQAPFSQVAWHTSDMPQEPAPVVASLAWWKRHVRPAQADDEHPWAWVRPALQQTVAAVARLPPGCAMAHSMDALPSHGFHCEMALVRTAVLRMPGLVSAVSKQSERARHLWDMEQRSVVNAIADINLEPTALPIVVMLNAGFFTATHSWLCNVQAVVRGRQPLGNIVLVCTDALCWERALASPTFGALGALLPLSLESHMHVLQQQAMATLRAGLSLQTSLDMGSPGYVALMLARLELMTAVVEAGQRVALMESDALWLEDAAAAIRRDYMQVGKSWAEQAWDLLWYVDVPDWGAGGLGGGCFVAAPTLGAVRWMAQWRDDMRSALSAAMAAAAKPDTAPSELVMTDQEIIQRMGLHPPAGVRLKLLDTAQYPNGKWYESQDPLQWTASGAVIVQNNYVLGLGAKIARAQKYGHWFLTVAGDMCALPERTRAALHVPETWPSTWGEGAQQLAKVYKQEHWHRPQADSWISWWALPSYLLALGALVALLWEDVPSSTTFPWIGSKSHMH